MGCRVFGRTVDGKSPDASITEGYQNGWKAPALMPGGGELLRAAIRTNFCINSKFQLDKQTSVCYDLTMTRRRCYKFRIRPTPEQEAHFRQFAGCRRLVWNYFLQRRIDHFKATGQTLSFAAMCLELTTLKQQPGFEFLAECDSQALQQVLRDLNSAFINFFQKRARFPRRKSRKRTPHAFRIPQRVALQGCFVLIPKVGPVPIVLHREMEGTQVRHDQTGTFGPVDDHVCDPLRGA